MPKKGKKSKIPLTDEEQLLIFQQKLLADEEAAKKKERLLTQFLKVMLVCSVSCPYAGAVAWDHVIVAGSFSSFLVPLKSLVPKHVGFRQRWFLPRAFSVKYGEGRIGFGSIN